MPTLGELFDEAIRQQQSGQLGQAENLCRQILQAEPRHGHAWHFLGIITGQVGRPDLAAEYIGQALKLIPTFAPAHFNLGNLLREQGKPKEAEACLREVLRLRPAFFEAHNNLGVVLQEQRRLQEAEACYHAALRLKPGYGEAHNNLGDVLREQGRLEEAEASCREAVRLNPLYAAAHYNLGNILRDQGKLPEAEGCYREALRFKPDYAEANNNLGSALADQGKLEAAEACYREALRLKPAYAEAHNNLGRVLADQGKPEMAEACYREALRLKPAYAQAHTDLGVVRQDQGRLDEAEQCQREALRHDPHLADAWYRLANLERGRLPDADLEAMRQLRADPGLAPGSRSALYFGLAQVLDARQEFAGAAECLAEANALALAQWRRRGQGYESAAHTQFVDRLLAAFSSEFFKRVRGLGVDSELPTFIVGLPRSGTTLTEQILASHSQVFGAGELNLTAATLLRLAVPGGDDARALDSLSTLDSPTIRGLADWHLGELRSLHEGAKRIADKLPDNYLYLGFLAALFPRAKLIHCRRDLRDTAVSCWMTNFRTLRWTNAFEHIAARFRDYERMMNHWRQVLPMPLLEVNYEEIVTDLEGAARKLVSWCGLEWEPACLKFHDGARPIRTASAAQVRQPIFSNSVARWKNYEKSLAALFAMLPVGRLS